MTSFSHMDFESLRRQTYADFPGGYFDGSGVHWMLSDAIGSVELVIDGKGRVEQSRILATILTGSRGANPSGSPICSGGKERRRFASLGDSDFHARFLTTATALWQAPDVHAGKYPWLSPWVFCAANPIRYRAPSGKIIIDSDGILNRYKDDIYNLLRTYKETITIQLNLRILCFR